MVGEPLAVAAGETLPHWAAEQLMLQITPELSLLVAVNWAVRPGGTVAVDGVTVTPVCGAIIVIAADTNMFGSAAEMATTATLEFAGMPAGAV